MGVEWEEDGGGRPGILRLKTKQTWKTNKKPQLKITSVPFVRKFIFIYLLLNISYFNSLVLASWYLEHLL